MLTSLGTNERWETVYRQWGCIARAVFITNNPDTPGTMATIPTHRGSRGTMPDLWPYTFYISKPGTKRIHKQFPALSGHASISHFYFTSGCFAFLPQNDSIQKAPPPSCMTWRLPLCVSRTENFLSLEANQILEAAPGSGVFGNFKFETLLTPSFHVIDRKSCSLAVGAPCQIPGSIKQKLPCI